MNGLMVGMDKTEKADPDVHRGQLMQQLSLCKASWLNCIGTPMKTTDKMELLSQTIYNTVHGSFQKQLLSETVLFVFAKCIGKYEKENLEL